MQYRRLGKSGLLVSELSIGTNMFGGGDLPGWKALGGLEQPECNAIIKHAFDKGINFIDTADTYAAGQSEQRVGQAIRDVGLNRNDVVIMTKTAGRMRPTPNAIGASRGYLMSAVDDSLKRLNTDHIDVYLIHHFDAATPLEESLRALDDIVRSGKVRYVGCSNFAGWQVAKALGISERKNYARFDAIEAQWSIITRDIEREVVPMGIDLGVGILVWAPLVSGLLTGKYDREGKSGATGRLGGKVPATLNADKVFDVIDAMRPIAKAHDATVGQIAIAWLLHQKGTTSVIFGSRNAAQFDENCAATDIKLTADELATLDKVSALPPEYGMAMVQGTRTDRARYA